ncbi:hypothetical protein CBOM_05144 [Ceraceosorus bombacis]|uniref:Uncharacterized protein n=1 Tax=Ceraceosorus bombacis TaxID=401625 RepID=A0A0P1BIJ5_9BASI|nr:hypothetical protein CBOM_05144 [Ceraceosorus bombacis]
MRRPKLRRSGVLMSHPARGQPIKDASTEAAAERRPHVTSSERQDVSDQDTR